MGVNITISQKLVSRASKIAKKEGFESLEEFVEDLIADKIEEYEMKKRSKAKVFKLAREVRKALKEAGLTEEELMEDFERFRNTLDRETFLKEYDSETNQKI
jgi:metal-responsive CopG/Arc/MetJ family transcriptional regulator